MLLCASICYMTVIFEQFAPGDPSEVLITSADSRVRVFNGLKMIHKFRGKKIG